ncbi:hypothetical protein NL386_37870, partial [Klebsiella pneumoniae]|nr:hypothetical protein [Klebsiella pneumoniae]
AKTGGQTKRSYNLGGENTVLSFTGEEHTNATENGKPKRLKGERGGCNVLCPLLQGREFV